jgi:hypothetical protein
MSDVRNSYTILIGKPKEKGLGGHKRKLEHIIKMDLKKENGKEWTGFM